MLQLRLYEHLYLLAVDAQFLEQEVGDVLGLMDDSRQQVHRFDGLLAIALRRVDSLLDCLLRLDGKLV